MFSIWEIFFGRSIIATQNVVKFLFFSLQITPMTRTRKPATLSDPDFDPQERSSSSSRKRRKPINLQTESKSSDSNTPRQVSVSSMLELQHERGFSTRDMRAIMKHIRKASGNPHLFEPGFEKAAAGIHKTLEDLFIWDPDFPGVRCTNTHQLIQRLQQIYDRPLDHVNIGLDDGKGFLKVMMTLDFNDPNERHDEPPDTGRRRIIPLFVAPKCKESNAAISEMFKLLNFPNCYDYILSLDLKALNLTLGLSTHSSQHSCYACTHNSRYPDQPSQPRTLDSIRQNHSRLTRDRRKRCVIGPEPEPKDYFNCVAEPAQSLFHFFNPLVFICTFVAPPALHLLLGIFAWLLNHLLDVFPGAEEWPAKLHLLRDGYHGGKYNGNACRKMLKHLDVLETLINQHLLTGNLSRREKVLPVLLLKAFQALNLVVHTSFGKKRLMLWGFYIRQFGDAISNLRKFELSENPESRKFIHTPKIHILLEHVIPWCQEKKRGLGSYSEQSFETAHHDFYRLWEDRFKVSSRWNPTYGPRLLKCVLVFATSHIPADLTIAYLDALDMDSSL